MSRYCTRSLVEDVREGRHVISAGLEDELILQEGQLGRKPYEQGSGI